MTTPEDKQRQNWRELEKDIYLSSPQPVLDAVSPLLHTLTDEDKARLDELRADQQPSASRNPAYDWIVQQFKQVTLPATEQAPVKLAPSRKGRVYVAGPMTGIKDFNFPAFNQAAEELRTLGLTVLNPADHGVVEGATWADYLRHDIALLSTCERIHLLPGWPKSKGARLELHIAQTLGMEVTTALGAELVHCDVPEVNFGNTPEHTLTVYDHPEPHSHRWSDLEFEAIKRYAEAYALQAVEAMRREPMTEEQIRSLCKEEWVFETVKQWVRITEAHHHITQKEQGK